MSINPENQNGSRVAVPPAFRTPLGTAFTAANAPVALALQHCPHCHTVQYPPRAVCRHCLKDGLVWQETATRGRLLSRLDLHHSLAEYFKQRIEASPWPVASVRLDCGVVVFAHLALATFGMANGGKSVDSAVAIPGDRQVNVFSHLDVSENAVLIAVDKQTPIDTDAQRSAIVEAMGLCEPAK